MKTTPLRPGLAALPLLLLFVTAPNMAACTAAPQPGMPEQAAGAPEQSARALPSPGIPVTHVDLKRLATLRGAHILSPKSVIFSPDGSRFYINSLEGLETVVYDSATLKQTAVIRHEFGPGDADLFVGGENTIFDYNYNVRVPESKRNCFGGKPVECAFSHQGRYLWITYYRRTWDRYASSPSAVAILDTESNRLVRVMPTGPLPKMIVPSPDGRTMAIIHWGDNTIGLVDISSDNPRDFRYVGHLTDGKRLKLAGIAGDRDKLCGYCLRGAAFSRDSRYLFVGRMHGGGITVFDLETRQRLGTFSQIAHTPRHILLSHDGTRLLVSSNASGVVSELDVNEVLRTVRGERKKPYRGRSLKVGNQARTIAESPDGRLLFVACNVSYELVVVDIASWKKIASHKTAPYTVGLAVSPAGDMVVTTSQGRKGRGGHAVDVFRLSPSAGPGKVVPASAEGAGQAPVVPETSAPATDATPASSQAAPATDQAPVVPETSAPATDATPASSQAAPATGQAPVVPETSAPVTDSTPASSQAAPATDQAPVVPETSTPATDATPASSQAAPATDQAPVVPETSTPATDATPASSQAAPAEGGTDPAGTPGTAAE